LVAGAIARPSGATIRLRPPRRWNRMGMRATMVCASNRMPLEIGVHRHIEHDRARPVGAAV
jgi:hypothetical protein